MTADARAHPYLDIGRWRDRRALTKRRPSCDEDRAGQERNRCPPRAISASLQAHHLAPTPPFAESRAASLFLGGDSYGVIAVVVSAEEVARNIPYCISLGEILQASCGNSLTSAGDLPLYALDWTRSRPSQSTGGPTYTVEHIPEEIQI